MGRQKRPRPDGAALAQEPVSPANFVRLPFDNVLDSPSQTLGELQRPLHLQTWTDTKALRGLLFAIRVGLVSIPERCPKKRCGGEMRLQEHRPLSSFATQCSQVFLGNTYFQETVRCASPETGHYADTVIYQCVLQTIRFNRWMAFFHFLAFMVQGANLKTIHTEMCAVHKLSDPKNTVRAWLVAVQGFLLRFLESTGRQNIGGPGCWVVCDETAWGRENAGVMKPKAKPRKRRGSHVDDEHVAKRLPARTLWKKPAASKSSTAPPPPVPAATVWVWLAVLVGKGAEVYTHQNGKKRVSWRLLPRKARAIGGKPRGAAELLKTMQGRIKKGTRMVTDGWKGTAAAVKAAAPAYPEHHVVVHD
ncbi:unnamed protein product, partial [Effrenium voratum]